MHKTDRFQLSWNFQSMERADCHAEQQEQNPHPEGGITKPAPPAHVIFIGFYVILVFIPGQSARRKYMILLFLKARSGVKPRGAGGVSWRARRKGRGMFWANLQRNLQNRGVTCIH